MAAFRRPVVRAVEIPVPTWPAASVLILFAAAAVYWVGWRRRESPYPTFVAALCAAALIAYPFIRPAVPDALDRSTPSATEADAALTQLLTNIYRAFDYRTEEAVYDQLAVSAVGDQLARIYLEHRNAMELENRGGARASVDEVDVTGVNGIIREDEGFVIDAEWTVSGSVSHFGHVHYRTNRYHADVRIEEDFGSWKIGRIDVMDEERIL